MRGALCEVGRTLCCERGNLRGDALVAVVPAAGRVERDLRALSAALSMKVWGPALIKLFISN